MNCRLRRQHHKDTLEVQVQRLHEELKRIRTEYKKLERDRDQFRHMFEKEKYQNNLHQQQAAAAAAAAAAAVSSSSADSGVIMTPSHTSSAGGNNLGVHPAAHGGGSVQPGGGPGAPPSHPPPHVGHLGDHLVDLRLTAGGGNNGPRDAYPSLASADNKINLATLR